MIDCLQCILEERLIPGKTTHEALPCKRCLRNYDQYLADREEEEAILANPLLQAFAPSRTVN